jgi:hypothetical protein
MDINCLCFIYDKGNSGKWEMLVIEWKYSKFNRISSQNSLWYGVFQESCYYWIYLNFDDIYVNTLFFQENGKSIAYIKYSAFNKLILVEDFHYRNVVFYMSEVRFYMSYTNVCTLWSNCVLIFVFTCNLIRF